MSTEESAERDRHLLADAEDHIRCYRYKEAAAILAPLVARLHAQGVTRILATSLLKLAISQYELKQLSQARASLTQALDLNRSLADVGGAQECLYELSLVARAEGRIDESVTYCEHALELAISSGDIPDHMANHLAVLHQEKGEFREARAILEILKANAERASEPQALSVGLNELGIASFALGDIRGGILSFSESIKLKMSLGNVQGARTTLRNLLQCLAMHPEGAGIAGVTDVLKSPDQAINKPG